MRLPEVTAGTLLRLLLASLVVGMIMAVLHVTPHELLSNSMSLVRDTLDKARLWAGSILSYILLGAVIVVPIWLIGVLLRTFRRR